MQGARRAEIEGVLDWEFRSREQAREVRIWALCGKRGKWAAVGQGRGVWLAAQRAASSPDAGLLASQPDASASG